MGRKLFVGNLSFNTDEHRLEDLSVGRGSGFVNIVHNQMTGRARGFAFIEMDSDELAQSAIQKLNETELDGRKLAVNEARPKPTAAAATAAAGRAAVVPAAGTALVESLVGWFSSVPVTLSRPWPGSVG